MENMFLNVTLSTANYDSLLSGWSTLPSLQNNVTFSAGNSKYSDSVARSVLTDQYNWIITDGGIDTISSAESQL
jgi:hypothetical protein